MYCSQFISRLRKLYKVEKYIAIINLKEEEFDKKWRKHNANICFNDEE